MCVCGGGKGGARGRRKKHPIGSHKWNKYWVIV